MESKLLMQDKILLMTLLGYEYITIGYFGFEDETQWQRDNEDWLDNVGLSNVGNYFVKMSENEWYDADNSIDFTKDWNWLMKIIIKLQETDKNLNIVPHIMTMYQVCLSKIENC